MAVCSIPESLVIGRIVVFTSNRFVARAVEETVRSERLAERLTSGMLSVDGETVHWIALPKTVACTTSAERSGVSCS